MQQVQIVLDRLPPLREVIEQFNLAPKKKLGQNFILDTNLLSKIAKSAGPLEQVNVIEIGPGPGGLTRQLLEAGAQHVTAIETDKRCLPVLEQIAAASSSRLSIINGDALKLDLSQFTSSKLPTVIVANLPYNVGTQLLINWLLAEPWPPFYQSMTLMFQREVAERIVATPNAPAYGRLSVLAGWRAQSQILFDIPPQAFWPPPKVTSSLIQIRPNPAPLPVDPERLARVTCAAFGQRRKMLRQSLKSIGGNDLLASTQIEGTRRAETLSMAEFVQLANAMVVQGKSV